MRRSLHKWWSLAFLGMNILNAPAQVDPIPRNQIQLGYDQFLSGKGPQAAYAYYYLNVPELTRSNLALRMAVAPAYLDSELGIRGVLTPYTDLGLGIAGGAFGDSYYEVRQGRYYQDQSFDGYGGGAALSLYQLLNPGQLVPLNVVARGGFRYTTYAKTGDTAGNFEVPADRMNLFTRAGLRLAGKEPVLYPDLGLELSVWFERQWRLSSDEYGFADDRQVNPNVNLYWAYAGLNYAWTNIGHQISFAVTVGGSDDADRFSAWRLGGVLPLVSEFPLVLPGYYYEEISAERFVHLYGSYAISLDLKDRWSLRLEGASARVDYLPGFAQTGQWNTGVGGGIVYTSLNKVLKVAVRYGYGFDAIRNGQKGANSVGILLQYDFHALKQRRSDSR
jgi:hypothetical protein